MNVEWIGYLLSNFDWHNKSEPYRSMLFNPSLFSFPPLLTAFWKEGQKTGTKIKPAFSLGFLENYKSSTTCSLQVQVLSKAN